MAAKTSRPGRTLLVFLAVIAILYAAVAAIGTWKPKLGLDLQGGQRITLQAKNSGGGAITSDKLDEAVNIISSRVNGAGVSEAEVSTQGNDIIVVEIPGKPEKDLTRSVGSTAQLRFRLVALSLGPPADNPSTTEPTDTTPTDSTSTDSTDTTPTEPTATGKPTETDPSQTGKPPTQTGNTNTTQSSNRAVPSWALEDDGTTSPTESGSTETTPTEPTGPPPGLLPPQLETIDDPYSWVAAFRGGPAGSVDVASWQQRLAAFDCDAPLDPTQAGQIDLPDQPLLACDEEGGKYLLGPSMVDGTDVTSASSGLVQGGVEYAVDLNFNGEGAKLFGEATRAIAQVGGQQYLSGGQLAIVLDGEVLSAPVNQTAITGGQAQITGSSANPFTQESAASLANSLKYGALPLTFSIVNTSNEGPELASNQLDAGIIAGVIGLILVVLYCIVYYRGLSIVIIASLGIAGVITYASVLLLGHAYGFTLTLPGIAGLIVAIGITADSFIVYFERLRDEVRDGRTLRTSVETGWARARTTILAADAVSLLAAVVLFIFAIGVVKGFAFALGLSTVIDVFVVFFFTKPMVTLLSRTKFFGQGHKLSGLDRQHLGMPPLPRTPRTAGGEA